MTGEQWLFFVVGFASAAAVGCLVCLGSALWLKNDTKKVIKRYKVGSDPS